MLSTLLIVCLVLAVVSALRTWPYNTGWGELHSNRGLSMVLAVIIILAFTEGFIDL